MFLLSNGTKPGLQYSVCESARPPGAPCSPWGHEHGAAAGPDGAVRGSEDAPAGLRATASAGGKETVSWRGEENSLGVKYSTGYNALLSYLAKVM